MARLWPFAILSGLFMPVFLDNREVIKASSYRLEPQKYNEERGTSCGRGKNVCVRKCCDKYYTLENETCVLQKETSPNVNLRLFGNDSFVEKPGVDNYFLTGAMQCVQSENAATSMVRERDFSLQTNGTIFLPSKNRVLGPGSFCIDFCRDTGEVVAICCSESERLVWRDGVQTLGMIISMPFLLVTFLVYAILPDRNLHRKSLMCYVFTLLMAYLLLVSSRLHPGKFSVRLCKVIAIFCLFFFMVSFFWLNVLAIDIWYTFSYRGLSENESKTDKKCFLCYSIYAWGVPLVLANLVTILTLSDLHPKHLWYNPGIGDGQCWFRAGIPELLYLYGPVGVLIIFNTVLFIMTAWNIKKVQQKSAAMRRDDNSRRGYTKDKQRFEVYLKLMLVMGVNWSLEILSWVVNWQFGDVPPFVWYLTDLWNALIGVFIFFIFVFKRHVWNSLRTRYNKCARKFSQRHPYLSHSQETFVSQKTTDKGVFSIETCGAI